MMNFYVCTFCFFDDMTGSIYQLIMIINRRCWMSRIDNGINVWVSMVISVYTLVRPSTHLQWDTIECWNDYGQMDTIEERKHMEKEWTYMPGI